MKKRAFLLLVICGALLNLTSPFITNANAEDPVGPGYNDDAVGQWVNKNVIKVNGVRYIRGTKLNASDVFIQDGDSAAYAACYGTTYLSADREVVTVEHISNNNKKADLASYDLNDSGSGCNEKDRTEIALTSVGNADKDPEGDDQENTGDVDLSEQCAIESKGLGWLVCGMISFANSAVEKVLNSVIVPLLDFEPLNKSQEGLRAVWGAFKNFANVLFVLVFLAIVFANTLSINIDAYTIKKMLPRLVVAVILVQFSYLLSGIIIDIGNVLGQGIAAMVNSAVKVNDIQIGHNPSAVAETAGGIALAGIGLGVVGVAGVGMAVLFTIGALVSFLGLVVALMIRHLALALFIVLSPVAIACMVLPNTSKWFKFWYENFIKVVMMYPFITLLFSLGAVLGATASGTASGGEFIDGKAKSLEQVLASAFPIIAFMLIPWTFRMAGSAVNRLTGLSIGKAGSFGKNLRRSQLGKDIKQGHQERALTKFGQADNKMAQVFRGAQAGTLPVTKVGQRKLAGRYQKLLEDQGKEVAAQVNKQGLSFDDKKSALFDIAMGNHNAATGVDGRKNPIAQSQAIKMLGQMGGWDELRVLSRHKGTAPLPQNVWDDGMRENTGDTIKKAPDLMMGAGAFKKTNAEKMIEYHGTTGKQIISAISSDPEAKKAVFHAFRTVAESPSLRGKIDSELAWHLLNNADEFGMIDGVNATNYIKGHLSETAAPDPKKPGAGGAAQVKF